MSNAANRMFLTMSDIARLADVKRPVVSMWRSRTSASDQPFPAAITLDRGQELFDAVQVGAWLNETGRGNNPTAAADAAAHAVPFQDLAMDSKDHSESLPALTALLALRSRSGVFVGLLELDDLLDTADECDPDDEFIFREIEASARAPEQLRHLARFVDQACEAGFGEAAVFDRVANAHLIRAGLTQGSSRLSQKGTDLVAGAVSALVSAQPGPPTVIDVTGGASDALVAVAADETASAKLTVFTTTADTPSARFDRRHFAVHGVNRKAIEVDDDGSFDFAGAALHLVQLPADERDASEIGMLSAIEKIVVQMDRDQLALVLAPSSVLSDGNLNYEADRVRSDLLRSGRLRAIVRLPAGLWASKPRQSLGLWVIGETRARVALADRWTMTADLSSEYLDKVATADLVSDLVASLGDRRTINAHAFRFSRLVLTRTLLAGRRSLVESTAASRRRPATSDAAVILRVEQLFVELYQVAASAFSLDNVTLEAGGTGDAPTYATVGQLVNDRHLRYIAGNRLSTQDIEEGKVDVSGIRVIGSDEILGGDASSERSIDRLRFAAQYPAGRVTEPGDIVFCSSPRPRAMVDAEGTSVVLFPARILRIDSSDPGGLLGEVIEADINALAASQKQWRKWPLTRFARGQTTMFSETIASIRADQRQARERIVLLDELSRLLTEGITSNRLSLVTTSPEPARSKGSK